MKKFDDTGIRWSEAEEKDLVPGLYLYRNEGDSTWLAEIGENKTFTVTGAFTTSISNAKEWGFKIEEREGRRKFPILSKYKYRNEL